ncbi:major facilitator transporter [Pandoraea captiosa]|uniref:Major facilitator transporter n=1 Tax=Pandoraea captiosa TaxID=2508302 RepID=A0A5E5AC62_9BURK|nr:MFS transporter [Pandoraea captiosa]VVE70135.1 major facilitator transporter [Pandoraea captiosa]
MDERCAVPQRPANSIGKAIVVIAGPALAALIPMAVTPALPALSAAFGHVPDGTFFAQMVMAAPAAMVMLGAPAGGALSERFGRRKVILIALLLFLVSGIFPVISPNAAGLIASRLILGIAGGVILTTSFSMAGDYGDHTRERILGFAGAGAAFCAIVGMVLGGLLVDALGWRGPFVLYLIALPVLVLSTFVIDNHKQVHSRVAEGTMPIRAQIPIFGLTCLLTIGLFMPGIQGPFLLRANGITSAATIGAVLSTYSLTAACAAASYGTLRRALSANSVLALAAFCLGVGAAIFAVAHSIPGALAGCIVTGVGAGLVEPVTMSLVLSRSHPGIRQRCVGLLLASVFLGQFLNPVVLSPLRAMFDEHGAFAIVGTVLVGFAALILWRGFDARASRGRALGASEN